METDARTWKRCNTCKRPIPFRTAYYACSVSTCNRKGTDFVFCSVACWDAHVPTLRHRDAWADEKAAPTAEEHAREQRSEPTRRLVTPAASARPPAVSTAAPTPASPGGERGGPAVPRDVLVVVSKLKLYVRQTAGMNTSDDVVEPLSDRLRIWCDDAIERARADGRKTVMARDFRRQS
jgi:hypothetical protein